jgi:hypothetical protein
MGGKILRRCDSCKEFHASYLVVDPETGKNEILCQKCWKKRFGQEASEKPGDDQNNSSAPPPQGSSGC